jgi:signal transduction histidine kinase/DNA-binding NarL/FixJ family response regulator
VTFSGCWSAIIFSTCITYALDGATYRIIADLTVTGSDAARVAILNFIPTRGLHGAWRFLWGLPLATLLALIAVFTLDYRIGMPLMQGIALVYSVTLPLFSLTAWRHGFRPASYALASFGLFYVVTVLRIGVLIGWWPAFYGIDLWLLPLAGVLMSNLLLMAQMEQLRESRATQLTNLAELAAARDAAHRANRAKGMFLARVSHDLRTPLHTLSGYLELAQREGPSGALKRYLELIAVSGQKMLSLIDELLQFARGEEGRLELNAKPTFLHLQIQQAAEQAEGLAARNANRFILDLDLDLEIPVAVLDGERLHSVLMNLLSNACRMTYGGRVTLSVVGKTAGRVAQLRFAVSDTGPGIAPEDQERVFLPFEHSRSDAGSTGLGLAIARQLVRLMGGELSLKSRPGEGATFSFILTVPLADESEVPPPATLAAPFGYEGSVRTLLVVDDVPENRVFLQDLLTGMGFDCLLAEGVSRALRLAEEHRLDAAIVDQYLGDGDGWEILAGLKSSCPALPVILLSATPADPSRRQSSAWSFDAELLKPLRIEALTRVLGEGLHLVWQTQRRVASTPPSPSPAPAPASAPAAGPMTMADLLTLRQAAHEGSLFEVEDWIDLRRDRPEERTFVDQLSVMAADAQLGAIVRLVDQRMAAMDAEDIHSAGA